VPTSDADGLLAALERGERPVKIDLRSPSEHAQDHLPGRAQRPLVRHAIFIGESLDRAE